MKMLKVGFVWDTKNVKNSIKMYYNCRLRGMLEEVSFLFCTMKTFYYCKPDTYFNTHAYKFLVCIKRNMI